MATTRPAYGSGLRAVERSGRLAARSDYLTGRSARHIVGVVAVVAACGSLALTGSAKGLDGFDLQTVLEFTVGCSFVASGLVAWSRRENRLGPLMTVIGITWFARPLVNVDSSPVFTGAIWLQDTWFLLFALFLLSLPYGRLASRTDFLTMGILVIVAIPLELAWLFFFDAGGPGNALVLWPNADVADAIDWGQRALVFTGSILLALSLATRWLRATAPLRRILIPALVGGAAVLVSTVTTVLSKLIVPPEIVRWVELCAFIAVPVAVLAGLLRARLARSSVGDVFVALQANAPPAALRDVLAHALDDASLELAFWLPDYGDTRGLDGLHSSYLWRSASARRRRSSGPASRLPPSCTTLLCSRSRSSSRLSEPPPEISLENARLQAELHARLEIAWLTGARCAARRSERQRLERDLHDGAQQRLIALSLELKLLRA